MVSSPELFVVGIFRGLTELVLMALLAQGVLAFLAGSGRQGNPVYQLFQILTKPVLSVARKLVPALILDKHLPLVVFFLLLWLWLALGYMKLVYSGAHPL